jgi:hypothetical protein
VQPQATAGSNLNSNVFRCPSDATVSAVTYAPVTAITGANTNTRSVSLVNKGQAGAGTTVVATIQYNSGSTRPPPTRTRSPCPARRRI